MTESSRALNFFISSTYITLGERRDISSMSSKLLCLMSVPSSEIPITQLSCCFRHFFSSSLVPEMERQDPSVTVVAGF